MPREIRLKNRPTGIPSAENFELVERPAAALGTGQLRVRNQWMSVDPYMRGRMNDVKSYIPPFQLGQVLEGAAVGVVEESRAADFGKGDLVAHFAGWRDEAVVEASAATKIDTTHVSAESYLGPLGVPGLTAYVGLTDIGRVAAGKTVFVSAASGAVGSVAVQIAKLRGARVVASAGSDAKTSWLKDLGADAVINYRATDDFYATLRAAAPEGIDIYFDNVGGIQLEAAIGLSNDHARFVLCGMIDQYNAKLPPPGPRNLALAITRRLTLEGFIITDYAKRFPDIIAEMIPWLTSGRLKTQETIVKGLDRAPDAFLGLFRGDNTGKMLVDLR